MPTVAVGQSAPACMVLQNTSGGGRWLLARVKRGQREAGDADDEGKAESGNHEMAAPQKPRGLVVAFVPIIRGVNPRRPRLLVVLA